MSETVSDNADNAGDADSKDSKAKQEIASNVVKGGVFDSPANNVKGHMRPITMNYFSAEYDKEYDNSDYSDEQ